MVIIHRTHTAAHSTLKHSTPTMGKSDQLKDFLAFDFSSDARYKEWRSKIELSSDGVSEQKLQAKWYKKQIDVNFDMAWLSEGAATPSAARPASAGGTTSSSAAGGGGHASRFTSSQFTPSSTASRQPEQPFSQQQQQQPQAGRSGGGSTGTSSMTEFYLFFYHTALVVLSLVYLVPIMPALSARAYGMTMQLATVGQGYKVFLKFGAPTGIWPFSWPSLRAWLAQVAATSELHFLLISVAFGRQPSPFLVVPLAIPALYAVLAQGAAKFCASSLWAATGKRLEAVLLPRQREAFQIAAYSEIAAAFYLIFGLFGRQRNFINVLLYWNLLKMRYHVSDQSRQHKAAWYAIGQKVMPIRVRFPLLDTGINYVSGWFNALPR